MTILYSDDKLPLGRYIDMKISKIIKEDPEYIIWLQTNSNKIGFSDEVMEEVYQVTGHSMDEQ